MGVLRTPAKGSEILSSKAVRDDVQYSSNVHFLPDHSDLGKQGSAGPGPGLWLRVWVPPQHHDG